MVLSIILGGLALLAFVWLVASVLQGWAGLVSSLAAVTDADRARYEEGSGEEEGQHELEVEATFETRRRSSDHPRTIDVEGGTKDEGDDVDGVLVDPCEEHDEGWKARKGDEVVEDCKFCES